ncbi:MAG TPA: hypothetical protein VGF67_13945 [Ktedonobacteraceae bacterium]
MHEDILNLISPGARLFTDIHTASQHHHSSFVNTDNMKVAGDLFQIGQKAYKMGADVQRRQYDPIFASRWQYQNKSPKIERNRAFSRVLL